MFTKSEAYEIAIATGSMCFLAGIVFGLALMSWGF